MGSYTAVVRPPRELPDLPPNAALLEYLRPQACWPASPGHGYTLGSWELHTHPDLMERLGELAPGWPLTAAYGVPMLACEGIAAVVALGTSPLAVRIGSLPPGIETVHPMASLTFVRGDWQLVDPWQNQLTRAEGTRVLTALVSAALAHAASLASP
jgi:hypothetical protein